MVFNMVAGEFVFYGQFEVQSGGIAELTVEGGKLFNLKSFEVGYIE